MCRNCLILLLITLLFISVGSPSLALPILQDGDILEEPQSLKNWFGLYVSNNQKSQLVPVALMVKRYHHAVADDPLDINNKAKWSGRSLMVNPITPEKYGLLKSKASVEQELILVIQSKALQPGTLVTAFPGNKSSENRSPGDFEPLGEISLALNNETYRLSIQHLNCRLKLIRSDINSKGPSATYAEQCLFNQALTDSPVSAQYSGLHLVWAGDIDGDKNLDLILDTEAESSYKRTLFLSKKAAKGQMVEESGIFWRPSGC